MLKYADRSFQLKTDLVDRNLNLTFMIEKMELCSYEISSYKQLFCVKKITFRIFDNLLKIFRNKSNYKV